MTPENYANIGANGIKLALTVLGTFRPDFAVGTTIGAASLDLIMAFVTECGLTKSIHDENLRHQMITCIEDAIEGMKQSPSNSSEKSLLINYIIPNFEHWVSLNKGLPTLDEQVSELFNSWADTKEANRELCLTPKDIADVNRLFQHYFELELNKRPQLSCYFNSSAINTLSDTLNEINSRVNDVEKKLLQTKNNDPTRACNIHSDTNEFKRMFGEYLFLEELAGGTAVSLRDVYIKPEYEKDGKRYDLVTRICEEANGERNPILILGKPGCGKSSFVSFLADSFESLFPGFSPVFIRLRNLRSEYINAEDSVHGILNYLGIPDEFSLEKSVVVLDGLDEICALYQRQDFKVYLSHLLNYLKRICDLQLIITSRLGYFEIDQKIKSRAKIFTLAPWSITNLETWGKNYSKNHPELKTIVHENVEHLKEVRYSDKRDIFAVPILFYMANARQERIANHVNMCSLYDAVLREVTNHQSYDNETDYPNGDLFSETITRGICKEIAFSMFKNGRLSEDTDVDPYLEPEHVDKAIESALDCHAGSSQKLTPFQKDQIKKYYAISFYYSKNDTDRNAVEFAHRTIAEYFIASHLIDSLQQHLHGVPDFTQCLSDCFGESCITTDISHFLQQKIQLDCAQPGIKNLKNWFEQNIVPSMISGVIYAPQQRSAMHVIDYCHTVTKTLLCIFEHLDCETPELTEAELRSFCGIIASMTRAVPIGISNFPLLPLCLNGFVLSYGEFDNCDMAEAHFADANLSNCKFNETNLTDASLNHSNITETIFANANLSGADLSEITQSSQADFSDASLQGADLSNSVFDAVTFENASLQEAIFVNTTFCGGSSFAGANLFHAAFTGTDIHDADIMDAIWIDEDSDDPEPTVLTNVKLTQSQFEYLSQIESIEIDSPEVVDLNLSKN